MVDLSSSSSSSSSDEEIATKKGGKKDAGGPAGLCFMAHGHKWRSRRSTRSPSSFCGMALEDKVERKGSSSDDDMDSEVSVTEEEIIELLEDNRKELKQYAKVTKKLSAAYDKVCAELAMQMARLSL